MANLIRLSQFGPVGTLQTEVDRLFDRFAGQRDEDLSSSVWSPRVDMVEREDAYVVHMDLPGLSQEDVNITYENGSLQVSGERRFERDEETQPHFHRAERWYGRFFRSFDLGREVDSSKIQATFRDGVLQIELSKTEESKPVRIEIE